MSCSWMDMSCDSDVFAYRNRNALTPRAYTVTWCVESYGHVTRHDHALTVARMQCSCLVIVFELNSTGKFLSYSARLTHTVNISLRV